MNNNHNNNDGGVDFAGPYGEIPRRLKDYYQSIQDETIPDRFLDLLEKLAEAEQAAAASAVAAPVEVSIEEAK